MIKYISLVLLAASLVACSVNEVNDLDKKNTYEHSEMLNKIKQYQQEDSLEIARMRKEIVLYRQTLLKAISDLDILAQRMELSQVGPDVQNAAKETASIKQQALETYKQKLTDVRSMIKSLTSDSLFTPQPQFNTISYSEAIANMDKEIRDIKEFLGTLDSNTGNPSENKFKSSTIIEKKAVKQAKPQQTKTTAAEEEINPEAQLAYENARILYDNGDYEGASILFRSFLDTYPRQSLAANAQYWLGESYYSTEEYHNAILEFENVVWKYPDSNKAPDAQFKLGMSYMKLGNKMQAKQEFEKIKSKYPNYERMNLVDKNLSGLK